DFADQWPTEDFGDWDAIWTGETFLDFDQYMFAQVQDDFENQVFGNVGGARVRYRDAWYRIRSTGITQDGISGASAERDTLFSDFDTEWMSGTFADFDAVFDDRKFEDFALIPLLGGF